MTDIKDDVEKVSIDKIIKYTGNPKSHPDDQIDKIASSIKNYGFDQPIVVDAENEIIKGHGRLEAAKKLGLEEVPVITQKDLSKAQVKAARLADNRTAESEWEREILAVELEELEEMDVDLQDTGFGQEEIENITGDVDIDEFFEEVDDMDDENGDDEPETATCPECGYEFEI